MADEKGYPVSGGNNGGISDDELARLVMSNLSDNFRSILDQLKAISSEIKKVSGQKTSYKPTYQQPEKRRGKELDKDTIELDTRRLLRSLEKAEKNLEKSYSDSARAIKDFSDELDSVELKNIDDLVKKRNIEIDKKYAELEKIELDAKKEAIEKQKRKTEESLKTEKDKQKEYSQELESLKGKTDSESIERSKKLNELLDATLSNIKRINEQSADDLEKINDTFEDRIDKLKRESDKEKRQAAPKEIGALEKAINALNSQKQQSPYLNELLGDENDGHKKTDFEKFEENRKEQLKLLDKASKALDEYRDKLKQDVANGKITQEQLEEDLKVVDKQKANIDRAKQAMEGWTPIRDAMQSAAKSLKDSLQNVIKNLAKFAFERLEDKYLKAYQEGFEKVYQSVENTRNQISARSKLDQGGFSEMQDQIQSTIEEQGLENVVAQSDVNEALISLSSAGITNTDMLKTLALEQAKLNAEGSSINISNEETLQRVQEYIGNQMAEGRSYEEALSDLPKMFEKLSAYEAQTRDYYGHDLALQGGQYNKIINEIWDMANTAGKSWEDAAKDIQASASYSQAEFSSGLSGDTLMSFLREIRDGNITNASNFSKILYVTGMTQESLQNMSVEDALGTISNSLEDALSKAETNPEYLKQVMDAYGISNMTPNEARKFLKGLDVGIASDEEIENYKLQQEQALKEGTYYSATQNWQKKAENKMAEIAIDAEKQYKGNTYVEEGFKEVTGLLGSIEDAVLSIGETAIKNGLGNTVGSFFGSKAGNRGALNSGTTGSITDIADDVVGSGATGQNGLANILSKQNVTDFMKGTRGTTAGTVGRVAGGVVGAGMVGYSVVSHIADREGGELALETINDIAQDSTTWAGIGTAVGSAVGGPIAGAVVGALMGTAGEWGGKLGDYIATKMDPFQKAVAEFKKTSDQQLLDSKTNLEETKKSLATYEGILKKNDKEEMKHLLMEEANISAQDLRNAKDEDIQKLFEDNLVEQKRNLEKEAEQQLALDTIINKNAQSLVNIEDMFGGLAQAETGTAFEDMTSEEQESYKKKLLEGSYGNTFRGQSRELLGDVGKRIDELQSMSDDEISNYLVRSGVFSASEIKSMDEAKKKEAVTTAVTKEFENMGQMSAETAIVFENEVSKMADRKKIYEKSEEELQKRWDNTKRNLEELGEDINETNMVAEYIKLYHPMDDIGNFNSDVTSDIILNSDGTVSLNPGIDYKNSYRFESGLTEVPVDEYPALLHEGERVLTKEEAEAYNMISSTAIKNAYGNADTISSYILSNLEDNIYNNTSASNVFATRQYGTDNVEKSIDNQTNSLSELLEQILEAIKGLGISLSLKSNNSMSAAKYNVIKGNSNVTQLNTL